MMGWWPWSRSDDPIRNLDPSLRDFLKQETPRDSTNPISPSRNQEHHAASSSSSTPKNFLSATPENPLERRTASQTANASEAKQAGKQEERALPKESLFQDGRYKHIWSTYRPFEENEEAGKSDEEKLEDIVGAYKERQDEVKRAAMDNCVDFQYAVHDCFRTGSWSQAMTMCRAENKALERCVVMQARFLRALGFMSMWERSEEETERIQMHADKLFHRMLDQERQMKEARERGEEEPKFAPLMRVQQGNGKLSSQLAELPSAKEPSDEIRPVTGSVTFETLPKHAQEKLVRERFAGLTGVELELAKRELNQEIAFNEGALAQLTDRHLTAHQERLDRLHRGEERITDKVFRYLDFRQYPEEQSNTDHKSGGKS